VSREEEERALGRPGSSTFPSATSWVRLLAVQDVIMLAYLLVIWRLVWGTGAGPEQDYCARRIYVCVAAMLLGAYTSRGSRALPRPVRWIVYRIAITGVLLENYLMLRELLPLVRPDAVDDQLFALDLRLFHVEPALWLERINLRPIIEYFSFFYFSYFFICGAYLIGAVGLSKGSRRPAEFAVGTLLVFTLGQLGYLAVPATGPITHLASHFLHPVNGGFFWGCVSATVESSGAMKDVFPSLHTGVPTWFTLFAVNQARSDPRWKWPARITGFFAANIIFSTMLLRWHYAIDVVAGLALASFAGFAAPRLIAWEERWRGRHGYAMPWDFSG
jgi:membrane-associated phospholipid phosphatase